MKYGVALQAPCKDCKRRHFGCHSTCKEYQEFCEKKDKIRAIMIANKEKERIINGGKRNEQNR